MEVLKATEKPELKESSPFIKYLFIGANNEGFWNSYHMSLHFKDVVNCLMVLYPEFEFVFLFGHSQQGHARKRHGALNAQQMSQKYGGTQPTMRDMTIMNTIGYLGTQHLPSKYVGCRTIAIIGLQRRAEPEFHKTGTSRFCKDARH
jgi:hypothetical protein